MGKRQARFSRFLGVYIFILSTLSLLLSSGCSTIPLPETQTKPSATNIPTTKTLSATSTINEVKTIEISPTIIPTFTPTFDCLMAGGRVQDMHFPSVLLESDSFYKIYLPPCYDANADQFYPTIYLLHGLSYDNHQWLRLGLEEKMNAAIRSGIIPPFIVVLPQETRFDPPPTSLFDDVLVSELIPHVDENFHTLADKSFRAVGGVSRGAAWAVRLGFEHHDLFGKVGSHSLPLFASDISHIQVWFTQTSKEDLPLIFIDIGRDDLERASAFNFANQLDQYGIPYEWYLFNGGHTESYWSEHLDQYLRWYSKDW